MKFLFVPRTSFNEEFIEVIIVLSARSDQTSLSYKKALVNKTPLEKSMN